MIKTELKNAATVADRTSGNYNPSGMKIDAPSI
jgi:hypothetical protein